MPEVVAPDINNEIQGGLDVLEKIRVFDSVPVDEGGEPLAACGINDFMEQGRLLAWAGVGFGQLESYQVMCSLRRLGCKVGDVGVTKLRFWGKVLALNADYYVAEGEREGGGGDTEGGEEEEEIEPAGAVGVNQYAFWVTTDLTGEWTMLPDIKPSEILAARRTKKLLSGTLDSPVVTHPSFPGSEKVLLRALIAQISADTVLCMKGYLIRAEEEDDPTVSQNEEFQPLAAMELLKKGSWIHMLPHILNHGRTTHPDIPEEEEENDEVNEQRKKMMEEQEADPARDHIRSIEVDGLRWSIRQAGDTTLYQAPPDTANPDAPPSVESRAVTSVRSLTWPGAVCVSRGSGFHNFYVGYGMSSETPDFFFRAPPDVQDEPLDPGEPEEPQGEEAPKEEEEEEAEG